MKLFELLGFTLLIPLCNGVDILQVRFSPGTSTLGLGNDGIIEVLAGSNVWGTVCNIGFGILEAQTACYMLGFEASKALVVKSYDSTTDNTPSITVSLLNCAGKVDLTKVETITLSRCDMRFNQTVDKCGPASTKASIYCPGAKRPVASSAPVVIIPPTCDQVSSNLRLVDKQGNSVNTTGGRVEFNINGTWSTVCKFVFDINAAKAICGSLCTNNATFYARPSEDFDQAPLTTPIGVFGMSCSSDASSLSDCTYPDSPVLQSDCKALQNNSAAVECGPPVVTTSTLKSPTLRCDNPHMIVTFNYNDNLDLTEDMVSITTIRDNTAPNCNITVKTETNKDIVMTIPMALCGAKVTSDSTSLTLTITIIRMVKAQNNVFKSSPLTLTASCRFPRENKVGTGGLGSEVNTLAPIAENDTIPVTLSLFRDSKFNQKLPLPADLQVGTQLYATVVANNMPPAWVLTLINCFTTSSIDRTAVPKYDLIVNRCPIDANVKIVPLNNSAVSFSFKLFPLSNNNNPTSSTSNFLTVYLHCDTRRCDPTVDGYSSCSNVCNKNSGKRRKRSANPVEPAAEVNVDVGPLLFNFNSILNNSGMVSCLKPVASILFISIFATVSSILW